APSARVRVTWTERDDVTDAGDALFTIDRTPVADAGPDQTVELSHPITLDGRGSSGPAGGPLQFRWKDPPGRGPGPALDPPPPLPAAGRGASDPDGDPLQFEWKDASGAVVGTTAVVTL